jgi:hypothetical protein
MNPEYGSWVPWDVANPPLGARVAAALKAGSTPYRSEAILSVIDVYRHRSFRSNVRHIRRK